MCLCDGILAYNPDAELITCDPSLRIFSIGETFLPSKCNHLILEWNFSNMHVFESSLLHPGFFSCWSLSSIGSHGSLPVVLLRVETGHIISRSAGYSGRLGLDHYVGSWKTHTQTKNRETFINTRSFCISLYPPLSCHHIELLHRTEHCPGLFMGRVGTPTKKANTWYLWSLVLRWRWGQWGWSAGSAPGEWTDGTGYDLLQSGLEIPGYSPLDHSYLMCKNEHTHRLRGNMKHF